LEVYTKITEEEFYSMKLGDHIIEKPAKNCKQYALKLVEYYLELNPNTLNHQNVKNFNFQKKSNI
jgi:hypothetical protein